MKKTLIVTLGLLMVMSCKAQDLIEVSMEYWRSRKAVDSLYQNDILLKAAIVLNDADIAAITTRQDTDSARIDDALTQLQDSTKRHNALSFGAVTGSGSDSAAFNDCLAAAVADSGVMFIPRGYYHCNNLDVTSAGGFITIIAEEGTVIDGTGSGESYLFNLKGTLTDDDALDASPSVGDTSITSTLASDVVAGDIILIKSTVTWNPSSSASEVKSEMCEVAGASGTTIRLKNPLFDSYNSANCTLYKMNMPKVTVKGVTLLGGGNVTGIRVYCAKDIDISGNNVSGTQTTGISTQYVYGGQIDNNRTNDTKQSGQGYGIGIGSAQNINVSNNTCTDARHSISVGGIGISRKVNIESNHLGIYNSFLFWCIDFHSSAEHVDVVDNTCMGGGIYSECDNITVTDNRIFARDGRGITFWLYGARGGLAMDNINITDNYIESLNTAQQTLQVVFQANSVTVKEVKIDGNEIISPVSTGIYFADGGNTGEVIDVVKISDNIVDADGGDGAISINENELLITNLLIQRNELISDYSSVIYYASADSATVVDANQIIKIEDNYIKSTGSGEYVVRIRAGNDLVFKNNIVKGVSGDRAYSMQLFNVGHLDFQNNTVMHFSNRGGVNMDNGAGGGPETAYLNLNRYIDCSGSIDNGASTVTAVSVDLSTQTTTLDNNLAVDGLILNPLTINTQTGTSYVLVLADAYKSVTMNNGSASTLTIPLNSSVAFDVGTWINVHTLGAGQVTITLTGGVTGVSIADNLAITVKGDATLIKIGTDTWKLTGALE
jgi:hypothetical protein